MINTACRFSWILLAFFAWNGATAYARTDVPDDRFHLHLLSGSDEYQSDKSLKQWSKQLTEQGYICTFARDLAEESRRQLQSADPKKEGRVKCKQYAEVTFPPIRGGNETTALSTGLGGGARFSERGPWPQ